MSKIKYLFAKFFLFYIRILAKIELWKVKPDIIGITGSAGKSSVRNAVYVILKSKFTVKKSGKANSESGIPLDILGLYMKDYTFFDWVRVFVLAPIRVITRRKKYEKYVVEMGIDSPDEPKNMSYLLKIVRPDTGVFINTYPVHSENFDKEIKERIPTKRRELVVEKIADEKGKMIQSIDKNGYIIVNIDDKNVARIAAKCNSKKITISNKCGNVVYSNIRYDLEGFKCDFALDWKGKKEKAQLVIKNQVLGPKYPINFALGIGVGLVYGVPFKQCVEALQNYPIPQGRMSLIKGIRGSYIIDGSYNASAQTVIDSLEVLHNLGNGRKKIAVLGDMRELGQEVESEHMKVAQKVVQVADEIVLVGPIMKRYVYEKISNNGFDKSKIHWFKTSFLAKDFVQELIKGKEIVLVKGSQNTIFLERVVEEIMENKQDVDKLLCRRGRYWDEVRAGYKF